MKQGNEKQYFEITLPITYMFATLVFLCIILDCTNLLLFTIVNMYAVYSVSCMQIKNIFASWCIRQ